jgi:CheY-like chemotaxis protein
MKQIVIIEDNAIAASLYEAALKRDGFNVAIATDGEAGLATIAQVTPDLVVLDLMLPKVDGVTVLRRIRQLPGLSTLPVVVTSNAYTAARMEELMQAGATQIVTKAKVSPKGLVAIVRDALAAQPARA